MLDLGWQELVLIACVLVLVVGPKDLPRVMKTVARTLSRARRMAREFQSSVMEAADQEEFREIRRAVDDVRSGRIEALDDIRETIRDTESEASGDIRTPAKGAIAPPRKRATKKSKARRPKRKAAGRKKAR